MLEVVLPFLYIKSEKSNEKELAHCYALFKRFVKLFLTNILHAKFNGKAHVLPYMKCSLQLMDLLLMYCDRELHQHLKKKGL